MIEFSCADFTFPLLSHDNALRLIKMMGIDWVDVGLFEDRSHIRPSDQFISPVKNGKALNKKARDHGLNIADIFMQTSLDFKGAAINHPDLAVRNTQREIYKKAIDYTAAAGCNHFSGLPGVYFDENSWAICEKELSWRVEYAKKFDITYAVEAHFGSLIEMPEQTLNMLGRVDGLTLTLDHSHYTAQGIDIGKTRPLMGYASHMHARGAKKGEMQTLVERSDTDFSVVAEHMKAFHYSGKLCMEYTYVDWENCNRTDNVSETIILRNVFKELLS
jgi:sugar phosphate isomerase/epimerase